MSKQKFIMSITNCFFFSFAVYSMEIKFKQSKQRLYSMIEFKKLRMGTPKAYKKKKICVHEYLSFSV